MSTLPVWVRQLPDKGEDDVDEGRSKYISNNAITNPNIEKCNTWQETTDK
jgi:hypothetical protein